VLCLHEMKKREIFFHPAENPDTNVQVLKRVEKLQTTLA
jgi:hypothetical protein